MTPRPYQQRVVDEAVALIRAGRRPLVVSPTGSGKSFIGSLIVRELDLPTLWLAHRTELVEQAAEELRGLGVSPGLVMAGRPFYATRTVQCGSILTVAKRSVPNRRLLAVDECHHAAAKTHRTAIELYGQGGVFGLTATPFRLDGQGLGDLFTDLVVAAYADDLVADGSLLEPRVYAPPAIDLAGLRVSRGGDYNAEEVARRADKPKLVGDVVQTWLSHAAGYRTVAYGCNVAHSKHLAEAFRAAGVRAEHVDGDTHRDDRKAALARFVRGETTVLTNVDLFTEGTNVPGIECVVLDRPTASLCLYIQMVGRCMRTSEGKRHPVVLDHAGLTIQFGRVTRRVEYSLTGRPKFAQSGGSGLRSCPKCFCVVAGGRPACPECGAAMAVVVAARSSLPDHADGSLQMYTAEELDRASTPRSPAEEAADAAEAKRKANDRTWGQLLGVAKVKRLSHGWVVSQYQKRTGEIRNVRQAERDRPAAEPVFDELPELFNARQVTAAPAAVGRVA